MMRVSTVLEGERAEVVMVGNLIPGPGKVKNLKGLMQLGLRLTVSLETGTMGVRVAVAELEAIDPEPDTQEMADELEVVRARARVLGYELVPKGDLCPVCGNERTVLLTEVAASASSASPAVCERCVAGDHEGCLRDDCGCPCPLGLRPHG